MLGRRKPFVTLMPVQLGKRMLCRLSTLKTNVEAIACLSLFFCFSPLYIVPRCDNDSFLNSNRVPIDKMIRYLEHYFSPDTPADDEYSLAISAGEDGARLTHSHARQYNFALQVE